MGELQRSNSQMSVGLSLTDLECTIGYPVVPGDEETNNEKGTFDLDWLTSMEAIKNWRGVPMKLISILERMHDLARSPNLTDRHNKKKKLFHLLNAKKNHIHKVGILMYTIV